MFMGQLFTSYSKTKNLKHKLLLPLKHSLLAVMLLCSAYATQAQNLAVTVNNVYKAGFASLEAAITAHGVALGNIEVIRIQSGTFNTTDWNWLKSKRAELSKLAYFEITSNVTNVADMPNTSNTEPYFGAALKEVSIAKLKTVGNAAFYKLDGLTHIDLPNATSLGTFAFANCKGITYLELPAVETIGANAFKGCSNLSSVSLPTVTNIGASAFADCSALQMIGLGAVPNAALQAFNNIPAVRYLQLLDPTSGIPLTGDALTTAQAAYKADSRWSADKWYGFSFGSITAKVNGGAQIASTSLAGAVDASGVDLASITSLEVEAGQFFAADWGYLKSNKANLCSLATFSITDGIDLVANMPQTNTSDAYFSKSLRTFSAYKLTHIGRYAFYNLTELASINLPQTITINTGSFANCSTLAQVNMPALVHIHGHPYLSSGGFYACKALASVDMPQLVSIGRYAFSHSGLTSANFPMATNIGASAFSSCPLINANLPNAIEIKSSAFSLCKNLTSVELPQTTTLENSAFSSCASLSNIVLPKVTNIEVNTFYNCKSLISISLPLTQTIGPQAIAYCPSLSLLQLGATPPTIEDASKTFTGCPSIRYLQIVNAEGQPLSGTAANTAVSSYKNAPDGNTTDNLWYGFRINENRGQLQIKVNNGTEVEEGSLQKAIETSGVPLENITQIEVISGDLIGADCHYLRGIASLEKLVFSYTTQDKLECLLAHPTLREVSAPNIKHVGDNVFTDCEQLTHVDLPNTISIGNNTFGYCYGLTNISLPKLTVAGKSAFSNCDNLKDVDLPELTSVSENMFYSCDQLSIIYLPKATAFDSEAFSFCDALTFISAPLLSSIHKWAFDDIYNLSLMQLGGTPPTTELAAFSYLSTPRYIQLVNAQGEPLTGTELTSATNKYRAVSDNNSSDQLWYDWQIMSEPTMVAIKVNGGEEKQGFSLAKAIEASGVELGTIKGIEVVGGDFAVTDWLYLKNNVNGLNNLKSFTITNGANTVASIPSMQSVFGASLKTVSISKVQEVGSDVFGGCTSLTTVNMPQAVKLKGSFTNCSALETVNLPVATEIGYHTFRGCTSLKEVKLPKVEKLGYGAFYKSFSPHAKLTLPQVIEVGESAFREANIASISLPKATTIGNSAFCNCASLTAINLPQCTKVGNWAFQGCTSLASVYLPKISTLGQQTFDGCTALVAATLPNVADRIDYLAFRNCSSLRLLQLGATPPKAQPGVFEGCPSPRYLQLMVDEMELLKCDPNKKIAVIKAVRTITGLGLYEAKTVVDNIANGTSQKVPVKVPLADVMPTLLAADPNVQANIPDYATAKGKYLSQSVAWSGGGWSGGKDGKWNEWTLLERSSTIGIKVNEQTDTLTHLLLPVAIANSGTAEADVNAIKIVDGNLIDVDYDYLRTLTALEQLTINAPWTKLEIGIDHPTLRQLYAPHIKNISANALANCQKLELLALGATPPTVEANAFSNCPSARYLVLVDADGALLEGDNLAQAQQNYKNHTGWNATEGKWYGWTLVTPRIITLEAKNGQIALEQGTPIGENQYAVIPDMVNTISFTLKVNSGYSGGSPVVFETGNEANRINTTNNNGTYSFELPAHNVTIRATFRVLYTITLQANPADGGTVSGGGSFSSGSTVLIQATPNSGYRFVRWSENGTEVSTSASFSFEANNNRTLVAEFALEGETGLFDIRRESLSVYPNPTQGELWLTVPEPVEGTVESIAAEVLVYNANGQLLQRVPARAASTGSAASRVSIDLNGYPSGLYIVRVGNAVAKVMKQ